MGVRTFDGACLPDTKHDEPFWFLGALLVCLWVSQGLDVDLVGFVDFGLGSVADEDGLSTPLYIAEESGDVFKATLQSACLENDVLALGDAGEVDLNLGQSQDVC